MPKKAGGLLLALFLLFVAAAPALAAEQAAGAPATKVEVDEALFKRIEGNLMCTDGCGMILPTCDNNTAQQMRQQLREKLASGAKEDEIYAYMISIYGPEVMAAPPVDNPLNVAAWVLPFVAILAGGLFIYLLLDKWVFNRRADEKPEAPLEAGVSAEYDHLLDEEMKKHF